MYLDYLLALVKPRVLAGLAACAALLLAAEHWGPTIKQELEMEFNPPASAEAPLAADILKDADKLAAARLAGVHRSVTAEIKYARSQGFAVDHIQASADAILAGAVAENRDAAFQRLNDLRMKIPRKKGFTGTANAEDRNPDLNDAPQPRFRPGTRKTRGAPR